MKIERKIQIGGWNFKPWKSIRNQIKKWWQEDLKYPRRKKLHKKMV